MNKFNTTAYLIVFGMLPAIAIADSDNEPPFVDGRPGNVESPIAVPPGYLQVESGLASYTYDKTDGIRTEAWNLAQTAFRYGVAEATDVQLIVSPYSWQHITGNGTVQGFGSTTLRLLHNFMGEDGSGPAFGLIGFVTLPTASNELGLTDKTEGGIIATGSLPITDKLTISLDIGEAARYPGNDYISDLSGGINFAYTVTDSLSVYAELFSDKVAFNPAQTTADFGVAYLLGKVTQLDAGVNLGINSDTPDANIFVGWSRRF